MIKLGDEVTDPVTGLTGIAVSRAIIVILENFQQADGSVKIPDVLRKYMPGEISEIRPK